MANPVRRPSWASRALMAAGISIGAGAAVLTMWLVGWAMVERAAGPATAWASSALLVLAGALWGVRAGVRVARYFGSPTAGARVSGKDRA